MGYFCVGANTYWREQHPDETHPHPSAIHIPFTTKYLDYLTACMQEALTKTGIDGFMIDWVYNASHFYENREYTWLDCEKQMYQELMGKPFPGDAAMEEAAIHEFNRRAVDRAWGRIRDAAKAAKPGCVIWLTCYDLQHPQVKGARMLKEVDWLMNEHPDTAKLEAAMAAAGPDTQLIQCICGWGEKHDAAAVLADPRFKDIGMYGYAKPDPETTLPPAGDTGNAKNIATMRRAFRGE